MDELKLPGKNWRKAVEHMAKLIRQDIDEEIIEELIEKEKKEENGEYDEKSRNGMEQKS